jgi:hypothetical protein
LVLDIRITEDVGVAAAPNYNLATFGWADESIEATQKYGVLNLGSVPPTQGDYIDNRNQVF